MRLAITALFFFFFNDTATTEIYTLSLHDALPISARSRDRAPPSPCPRARCGAPRSRGSGPARVDRKSTRLNSSHLVISYAVFCLKKKKKKKTVKTTGEISPLRDTTLVLTHLQITN